MILIIDNYDSFTFNLMQYIGEMNPDIEVVRNDQVTVEGALARKPSHIVVSPGPCTPAEAGISMELIRAVPASIPLLGVCLGHQSIGAVFGGKVSRAPAPMHGKTSVMENDGEGLFKGLPKAFTATRYHSLIVEREGLPAELSITAFCQDAAAAKAAAGSGQDAAAAKASAGDGTLIMGLRHRTRPIFGLQFHPESILTEHGKAIIKNFLDMKGAYMAAPLLGKLIKGEHLSFAEMQGAMSGILEGRWTPAQIGGFLIALRIKGETPQEIAAAVTILREKATAVPTSAKPLVDTCGTGGDHSGTFNISTAAAIVAAGGGAAIAKHGNRAITSQCGSANVLEELGIRLELTPEQVGECVDKCRIGFMLATRHHGSFKHVAGPRQELGQRTIFNMMGPMLNPARAKRQIIGVYDSNLTRLVAEVLAELRSEHVMVVAGTDGLDELTLTAPSKVAELKDGDIREYVLNPEDLSLSLCDPGDLKGGDAPANAAILRGILDGRKGAPRDITLLNAGAALYVSGLAPSHKEGVALARKSIDSGAARETLAKWAALSQSFPKAA